MTYKPRSPHPPRTPRYPISLLRPQGEPMSTTQPSAEDVCRLFRMYREIAKFIVVPGDSGEGARGSK